MFAKQGENVFLDIKLTNEGRRLLSMGGLNLVRAIYSDREINYKVIREGGRAGENVVLLNEYGAPTFSAITNYDGTSPTILNPQYLTRSASGFTRSNVFNSASTFSDNRFIEQVPAVLLNTSLLTRLGIVTSANIDGNAEFTPVTESPTPQITTSTGNLVLAQYFPPTTAQPTSVVIGPPFVMLWYRCIDVGGATTTYALDRRVANFGNVASPRPTFLLLYPMSGISTYYGVDPKVATVLWNMNIVRSSPEYGYTTSIVSAHTVFESLDYSGMKHFFGFDDNYRQVGFIHYTNAYTGKTFGDRLLEGTMKIHMPTVMWWRKPTTNPGKCALGGHVFFDHGSPTLFDHTAQSSYTLLKDGTDPNAVVVGRVYQKLGMIVITDPELLTALSYKSNRNWTLPPLEASLSPNPGRTGMVSSATGMCQSGKTYLVTYTAEYNNVYSLNGSDVVSFGYQPSMHCGYIQRVDYKNDQNGMNKFLHLSFPSRSFPYMRSGPDAQTFSGSGWIANSINILVKEMATSAFTGIDNVEATGWTRVAGNGIYGDSTAAINPYFLQAKQFVLSREDFDTGTSYDLDEFFRNQNITDDQVATSGLTYGMESFFYGNITCGYAIDDHVIRVDLNVNKDMLNSSQNTTFDGKLDASTYITEIGFFNEKNTLVATAKPTYPIKKNYDRHLSIRLELIY